MFCRITFLIHFNKLTVSQYCCICRWVTNNLCVSTWTGTEGYCRMEAMGVILGVGDSTVVEKKQKNLLKRLPGVQTNLVGWMSRLRVPCQAWEQVLKTEYNHYTVRPKHWHGLQGFTRVLITNNIPNPTKRNVFKEAWFTQLPIKKKRLGNRNTVSPIQVRVQLP